MIVVAKALFSLGDLKTQGESHPLVLTTENRQTCERSDINRPLDFCINEYWDIWNQHHLVNREEEILERVGLGGRDERHDCVTFF